MPEVTHAAEHHGYAALVGGIDHFLVAHRAAGLDHTGGARIDHHIEAVAEREEGVARHCRALEGQARVLRLDAGDAGRIEAAHLARAHAHGHAALAEDDGVALDVLGHLPGKQQVFHFFQSGLLLGHHLQLGQRQLMVVGRLQQQARADALGVHGVAAALPVGLAAACGQRDLEQAHIGLRLEHFQRFGREVGRHQHLDELLADLRSGRAVDHAVERDDAAKGAGRVGLESLAVGAECIQAHGHAAGIGMLDDHTGSGLEALDALPGSVGVGNVVVRELLALQLYAGDQRAGRGMQVAVQRGLLVAVFAVAQVLHLGEDAVALTGELGSRRHIGFGELLGFEGDGREVVADRAVVLRDAVERRHRQREAQLVGQLAARLQLGQHSLVLVGRGDHAHVLPVLGGAAHHGGAADVDVLDGIGQRATGLGHGGFKRIEVDHQQVDGVDAVFLQSRHVLRQLAARQQAAVHLGVQRLDAAVQHLGELRDLGHLGDGQALVGEQLGGAAGGQELDAQRVQGLRKFDDAGLVGDGEECVHGGGRSLNEIVL